MITKYYLSNQMCYTWEAFYYILPKLKVWLNTAVYFLNANFPEERLQVFLSKKELSNLPHNIPNIFKKLNIVCYMKRSTATLCYWECNVLKVHFQVLDNFWQLIDLWRWKRLLFHVKTSSRSQNIYIFVLTFWSYRKTTW